MTQRILVTGGCGFIGGAFIRHVIANTPHHILNIDKLTYAACPQALVEVESSPHYKFVQADIADHPAMQKHVDDFKPTAIINFAAESHVDRSLDGANDFIQTNIVGTHTLLKVALDYFKKLKNPSSFRFIHISTDEVFGSLGDVGKFTENSPYQPKNPYSATKASSDHFVRVWHDSYGLPTIISNCSNNFGPWQYPEKLIPLTITKCLQGDTIPIYGDGLQIRDWLYVDDHVRAILAILDKGIIGQSYNIGADGERTNKQLVTDICTILDELRPQAKGAEGSYTNLMQHVQDRPGHDRRYAMDSTHIQKTLSWQPQETVTSGLRKTIEWYLANESFWQPIINKAHQRLGLAHDK